MLKNPHITAATARRFIVAPDDVNEPVLMVWRMLPGQLSWLETAAIVELINPPDADWIVEALPLIPTTVQQYHAENSKTKGGS